MTAEITELDECRALGSLIPWGHMWLQPRKVPHLYHSNGEAGGRLKPVSIMSAAEPEAHYVLDGLMHNDVMKSDIHSTDTDGYAA